MAAMTPERLRRAGLEALRRELGASGMVRFIQQFEIGSGDYTAERWQWLDEDAEVNAVAVAVRESAGQADQPEG